MYIQPKGFPAILTDTLETWEGLDLQTLVIPGTLLGDAPNFTRPSDPLVRKLFFIGNNLAVAAAGLTEPIKAFISEVSDQIEVIERFPNPLAPIYEMLGGFEDRINVLAVYVDEKTFGLIGFGQSITIPAFDTVSAIGSGASALISSTEHYASQLPQSIVDQHSPYDLFADCFSKHIASMISNELIYGNPRDWGGFGEWGYYSVPHRKWVYSEPSLFAFVLALPLGNDRFTLMNTQYFFCYDAGGTNMLSEVLGVYYPFGRAHVRQWPLFDITKPLLTSARPTKHWSGWKPSNYTFHIFPFGREELGSITRCIYPSQQRSEIKLVLEPGRVGLFTSDKIINQWGSMAASAWGLEYVPQATINAEIMQAAYNGALKGGWD